MSSEGEQNTSTNNETSRQDRPAQGMAVLEYNPIDSRATNAAVPVQMPRPHDMEHPHTLHDVLRLSIAATDRATTGDGAHAPARFAQMDDQHRAFLEAALSNFTTNPAERMSACIKLLLSDNIHHGETSREEALEQIIDLVDNIDDAQDFYKIGGFRTIPIGLHSSNNRIRLLTATLIAELSQNNKYIQDRVLETDFLPLLLTMVTSDPDPSVQVKCFYAVSCIVREHEAALKAFSAQQGWSVLLKAMQSSVEKLQVKACFLLSCICTQTPTVIEELCDLGYIEQLCGLLTEVSQCPLVEHLLQALLSMARNSKQAVEVCSLPQLQLRSTLSSVLETAEKDTDDYRYAQQIKSLVFGSNYEDDGER